MSADTEHHDSPPNSPAEALESLTLDEVQEDSGMVDTPEAISSMIDAISGLPFDPPSIYIDLEGVNLSRHGTISILQIHARTTGESYLVDVKTLGEAAFLTSGTTTPNTLKDILESATIPKGIFDVRNDSDALYSHYGIKLQGILD
ncbi:ribonuclease H-like domain-containing protein [Nemania serpens]|nr:ribonuclease H-like domain-containing protein [Nemania serpens]